MKLLRLITKWEPKSCLNYPLISCLRPPKYLCRTHSPFNVLFETTGVDLWKPHSSISRPSAKVLNLRGPLFPHCSERGATSTEMGLSLWNYQGDSKHCNGNDILTVTQCYLTQCCVPPVVWVL